MQRLLSVCVCAPLVLNVARVHAQGQYPSGGYPLSIKPGKSQVEYKLVEVLVRDKTKLKVHVWAPKNLAKPKPKHVVLFIHGIALHGEPYGAIAAGFTAKNMVFVCPDLRGHGRSKGKPEQLAKLAPAHVLRSDIGAVIGFIDEKYPGAGVVLAGESMGGLIAADYASQGERPLAGLVLLAPAFKVHPELPPPKFKEFDVDIAAKESLEPSTHDKGFIEARQKDKLAYRTAPLTYFGEILIMQLKWPAAAAEIKVPAFVAVASDDRIVSNEAVKKVFNQLGTPKEQKERKSCEGAKHTLCWDSVTEKLIAEVTAWIRKNAETKEHEKESQKKKE
jgi:alpha-beta hydrolase superfamily lysophospholipase